MCASYTPFKRTSYRRIHVELIDDSLWYLRKQEWIHIICSKSHLLHDRWEIVETAHLDLLKKDTFLVKLVATSRSRVHLVSLVLPRPRTHEYATRNARIDLQRAWKSKMMMGLLTLNLPTVDSSNHRMNPCPHHSNCFWPVERIPKPWKPLSWP